jgi:hypothetical protein
MKVSSQPIRMKVAAHVDEVLNKSKGAVCKNATMYTLMFKTAATLLEEGQPETRTHARRILFALKRFLPASTLAGLVPHAGSPLREKRVAATLEMLGPPEAPPRLAQSFAVAVGETAAEAYAAKVKVTLVRRDDALSDTLTAQMPVGLLRAPSSSSRLDDSGLQRTLSRRSSVGAARGLGSRSQSTASRRLSRGDSGVAEGVTLQAQGSGIRRRGLSAAQW